MGHKWVMQDCQYELWNLNNTKMYEFVAFRGGIKMVREGQGEYYVC